MCCFQTSHLCWHLTVTLKAMPKSSLFRHLKLYLVHCSVFICNIQCILVKSGAQYLAFFQDFWQTMHTHVFLILLTCFHHRHQIMLCHTNRASFCFPFSTMSLYILLSTSCFFPLLFRSSGHLTLSLTLFVDKLTM